MRSARSIFIFNEVVTFFVILVMAFALVYMFQSHFKNTYIQSQEHNIDKVDLLIDRFLKERQREFTTITLRGIVDERDYLLNSFADVYYLDRNMVITRILKKARNSNIFKGYDLSKSRAGDFFKTLERGTGSFSSMFRSPENDTLSLYVAVKSGAGIIAGRIGLDSLTDELGSMVGFDGSILVFATEDGFVISSSNKEVPPHIDIGRDNNEISIDKAYLVSSRKSESIDSRIVLLTPMSEVYQILSSTMVYYPILIAAVLLIMAGKILAQLFLFIRPLESFTSILGNWNPEKSAVSSAGFFSEIKEINFLYKTFYDKALQLKRSVLEIIDKEQEMRRIRIYLKSIIDSMPSVLIAVDRNFNVNEWNSAAEKLTGIPSDETYGSNIFELIPGLKKIEKTLLESSAGGRIIEIKRESFEFAGSRLYNLTIFPVGSENDGNTGIRLDDVTELFRAEQNLVQSQKMEVIGTLAGGLAHDFNNILAAIMGSVSILQYRVKSSTDLDSDRDYLLKYLSMLEDSSLRASGVISRLLSLARKQDYDMKPVDLNKVISGVENICVNSFDKSISLSVKSYDREAMVKGDAVQLEQMLLNLCINGAHAMTIMKGEGESAGGILSITVSEIRADREFTVSHPEAGESKHYWTLSVEDTGIGISKKIIEKIFDPFFTTKAKGRGSGLGLSMVYGIVRLHGGFMDIYTEEGNGSRFVVYLPVLDTAASPDSYASVSEITRWSGTVLVIDDENVIRDVACELLSILGFTVLTASDGNEGLNLFSQNMGKIEFVILDMIMPGMTGLETFSKLREIKDDVKVLMSSGFRNDERIEKAISLGVQGFLQKPYSMEQFSEAIKKLMG